MTTTSASTYSSWLRYLLVIAGIFAIASVGFFLAIMWENTRGSTGIPTEPKELTIDQKSQVLNSLNASTSSDSNTVSTSNPASSGTSSEPVSASQADPNDTSAADKLKVLESLNGN